MVRIFARMIFTLITLLLTIALIAFWLENYRAFDTSIAIKYDLLTLRLGPATFPVWALMLLMLTSGFFVTFFLELIAWFKVREEMANNRRQVKSMEKEISRLRASSIGRSSTGRRTMRERAEDSAAPVENSPEEAAEIP